MAVKLQFRRDTAANWESNNTILSEGELGLDTTNERFKIGDGVNGWNAIDNAQYTNKAEVEYFELTLATTDWTGTVPGPYIATKTVSGILSTDRPIADLDLAGVNFTDVGNKQSDWFSVYLVEASANNEVKFYSSQLPTVNLNVVLGVFR